MTAGHRLIGDGQSSAVVCADGAITRLSVPSKAPRSSRPFLVAPDGVTASRQYYLTGTPVLVTELRCATGLVEITDAFTLPSGADLGEDVQAVRGELLRYVRVLEGRATLQVSERPEGMWLQASRPVEGALHVETGDSLWLVLRWSPRRAHHVHPRRLLDQTVGAWRRWSGGLTYDGPHEVTIRRAAVTLKLLLPHTNHNRADTAFALRRIGLTGDAHRVLADALDEDPVQAPDEILDCAFQWVATGGTLDEALWRRVIGLVAPTTSTVTHEVARSQVALDRAARISDRTGLPGPARSWSAHARELREKVLREAWDATRQSLTERFGPGNQPDPRLLTLPLHRVVPADHPRMVATARATRAVATAAPHACWLVDNLAGHGRAHEAAALFESLCTRLDADSLPDAAILTAMIASGVTLGRALTGSRPDLLVERWPPVAHQIAGFRQ